MKTDRIFLFCCALLFAALPVRAQHPFICADSYANKVSVVSAGGKIEWEFYCTAPQDCWRLPNGDYLFCHVHGAMEMTPDKKIVWEYKSGTNTEVHACQPLPDGRVLVVECGPSRIVEVDREGKVAKEIKLTPPPRTRAAARPVSRRPQNAGWTLLRFPQRRTHRGGTGWRREIFAPNQSSRRRA